MIIPDSLLHDSTGRSKLGPPPQKKIPYRGIHMKQMWNILYAANRHQPILHASLTWIHASSGVRPDTSNRDERSRVWTATCSMWCRRDGPRCEVWPCLGLEPTKRRRGLWMVRGVPTILELLQNTSANSVNSSDVMEQCLLQIKFSHGNTIQTTIYTTYDGH